MIIKSGVNTDVVRVSIVEANSDITEEQILEFVLLELRNRKSIFAVRDSLIKFIASKSKEESFDTYKDHYDAILKEYLIMLSFIFSNLNEYKIHRNNVLNVSALQMLPTSDLVFTLEK